MKNRFLVIVISALAVFTPLLILIGTPDVSAVSNSDDNQNHLLVKLTGATGGTVYSVTAKNSQKTYPLGFDSGKGGYFSPVLPGTGVSCAGPVAATKAVNNFQITVKQNGGVVGTGNYNFCDRGIGYIQTATIQIKGVASTKGGSVTGCVTYKDDQGKVQPFKSDATGTLKGPGGNTYPLKFNDDGCIPTIGDLPPGKYTINADFIGTDSQNHHFTKTFDLKEGQTYSLGQSASAIAAAASGTGGDQKQLDCDMQFDNPLTWIICPVIDILAGIVDVLDTMITNLLTTDTNEIFCNSGNCVAYYHAWQSFRNIALGLLAIAGLVVVISQALGFEILDAYTIRKVLPRLLIAVIAITLSWQLMKLAVNFTNDLGFGVRHLIYAPFNELPDKLDLSFGGKGFNAVFGSASAVVLSGGAIIASIVFIGIILSYAATAALAVFIAVLVLVLRQVLIIMLLLMAPIAIITFVFPNTQRIYKLWSESFMKALLMFPLIAAFIATGRVFSAIALQSGGPLNQMVGFAAYFAPYFLIPATFKLAGGALRQIGGFVNDRSRGAFDRLRQYRGNQMKQVGQDLAAGQALRRLGRGRQGGVRDRINKGLQKPTLVGAAGLNPKNWRRNMSQEAQRRTGAKRKSIDNEEEMAQIAGYDDLQRASTEGMGNEARMRQWLGRRTNSEDKSKYSEDQINDMLGAYSAATRGLRSKGYSNEAVLQGIELSGMKAKTAYMDEEDYDENDRYIGNANALENIVRLSGGDTTTMAQMIGQGLENTGSSGRKDILGSFSESLAAAGKIREASAGSDADKATTRSQVARRLSRNVINKEGIGALVGGNAHATEHLLMDMDDMITENYDPSLSPTQQSTDAKQSLATLGYLEEVNGTLPPEKQAMVARLLAQPLGELEIKDEATGKVLGTRVTTRQEVLREMTMDPEYNRYKSEYYFRQPPDRKGGATDAFGAAHGASGPGDPPAPPPVGPPG
jgi:hypothetical protein